MVIVAAPFFVCKQSKGQWCLACISSSSSMFSILFVLYNFVFFFCFVCSCTRGDTHTRHRLNLIHQRVSICNYCVQCDWQPQTDDILDKRRKPFTWLHYTSRGRWRVDPRNNSNGYQHAEHFKCNVCRHRWLPMQCKLCASGGDKKCKRVCLFGSSRWAKIVYIQHPPLSRNMAHL